MIPTDGGYFDPKSGEEAMFKALRDFLPNDYYVFHSYRIVKLIPDKGISENEIDFLVFHPDYGCLVIECKNARIKRYSETGQWVYLKKVESGEKYDYEDEYGNKIKEINMHDPFDQAFSGMHSLIDKLIEKNYKDYSLVEQIKACKFMVAVWLPKYTHNSLSRADFVANITPELVITKEALTDKTELESQIRCLMERMQKVHYSVKYEEIIDDASNYQHKLTHDEALNMFIKVLRPAFKAIVFSNKDFENTYIELLEEQYVVLDFLAHQRTAAISGASGTGKTLVAVERARRLSEAGNKVLFLCYNRNLMESLSETNKEKLPLVDFYTLDAFGCKKCDAALGDWTYYDLKTILENEIVNGEFEYKHIIVDEGQDFGRHNEMEDDIRSEILDLFSQYGAGEYDNDDTSFFVFYDKNQMVNYDRRKTDHRYELPGYLSEVDSKLTLYRNCRNTKNIANVAYSLLELTPIMNERAWDGNMPAFVFYSGEEEFNQRFDKIINELSKESGYNHVVISCGDSMKSSVLSNRLIQDVDKRNYAVKADGKKVKVYTCATFKGLEADDVIVTDINPRTFSKDNCDFYVAASRAKKRLVVMIDREKVNVDEIIEQRFNDSIPFPDKEKQIAVAMHAVTK